MDERQGCGSLESVLCHVVIVGSGRRRILQNPRRDELLRMNPGTPDQRLEHVWTTPNSSLTKQGGSIPAGPRLSVSGAALAKFKQEQWVSRSHEPRNAEERARKLLWISGLGKTNEVEIWR